MGLGGCIAQGRMQDTPDWVARTSASHLFRLTASRSDTIGGLDRDCRFGHLAEVVGFDEANLEADSKVDRAGDAAGKDYIGEGVLRMTLHGSHGHGLRVTEKAAAG